MTTCESEKPSSISLSYKAVLLVLCCRELYLTECSNLWICKGRKQQPNKEIPVVLYALKLKVLLISVLCCQWCENRRNVIIMWPNKTCNSGALGQQTQQMVQCSKDLKHISVLQPNSSVHRNTAEHAYRCLPTGGEEARKQFICTLPVRLQWHHWQFE